MEDMFIGASEFNQNISGWDVDQVADYRLIFQGATLMNANSQNKPLRFR